MTEPQRTSTRAITAPARREQTPVRLPALIRWRRMIIGIASALLLGVEGAWLAPYVGQTGRALTHADSVWVLGAVAAEAASMFSFAQLQRLIPRASGVRVRLRDAAATTLAGNALSVTLPGGSVVSLAYTTRRMRAWGVSSSLAGFSLAATAALSTIGLATLAITGASTAGNSTRLGWGVAEIAAVGMIIAGLIVLLRRPRLIRLLATTLHARWARIRPTHADRSWALVDSALVEIAAIRPRIRVWIAGLALAVLNWVADLLCLLAAGRALGVAAAPGTMLVVYAAAMTAASTIPLLPGGLGPLDAAMVLALTHAGAPVASATAAVFLYRSISLALVAAIGWVIIATQHRPAPGPPIGPPPGAHWDDKQSHLVDQAN